jgi:hypothetical protein
MSSKLTPTCTYLKFLSLNGQTTVLIIIYCTCTIENYWINMLVCCGWMGYRIRICTEVHCNKLIDWLVFNANFSNISAISWHEQIQCKSRHLEDCIRNKTYLSIKQMGYIQCNKIGHLMLNNRYVHYTTYIHCMIDINWQRMVFYHGSIFWALMVRGLDPIGFKGPKSN